MIMQAPTPYVPNRQLSFPTPATNFHLRQPNKRNRFRRGMGDCSSGPYGTLANGHALCIDNLTGNEVDCTSSVCSAPAGGSNPAGAGTSVLGPAPNPQITLGCGAGNIDTYLYQTAGQLIAMPSSGGGADPATILQRAAVSTCGESGSGAAFGCPPMQGCDAASIAALVAKYAALVGPAYNQYQKTGAYAPTSTGGSYIPPSATQAPVTPPPVINPPATQSNGTNQVTTGSGAGQSNTSNPLSVLPDLSSIPQWVWYAGGIAAALLVVSMVKK